MLGYCLRLGGCVALGIALSACSSEADDSPGQISDNSLACPEEPNAIDGTPLLSSVNRQQALKQNYVPPLLIIPAPYGVADAQLRPLATGYFRTLGKEVLFRTGQTIVGASAYRSFATQCTLFASYAQQEGSEEKANTYAARAGHSEHQLGTALDVLVGDQFLQGTGTVDEALGAIAYKYGFVLSYPNGSSSVTGYIYEPWHFRFVGLRASLEHHRQETQAGRKISTHEFVQSLTPQQISELEQPHSLDGSYLRVVQGTQFDMATSPPEDLCVWMAWVSSCVNTSTLLRCDYSDPQQPLAKRESCEGGCQTMADGQADRCSKDPVAVDPCSNVVPLASGYYCGEGLKGDPKTVYYCNAQGVTLSKELCAGECVIELPGTPDHCK